jgi:hypothetical protein
MLQSAGFLRPKCAKSPNSICAPIKMEGIGKGEKGKREGMGQGRVRMKGEGRGSVVPYSEACCLVTLPSACSTRSLADQNQ